jgi:hypothetical protein
MDHVHSWHGRNIFSNITNIFLASHSLTIWPCVEINPKPCTRVVFQTHGFGFQLWMDHVHSWHGQNIFSNKTREDILGLPFVNHCVLGGGNKPKTMYYWPKIRALQCFFIFYWGISQKELIHHLKILSLDVYPMIFCGSYHLFIIGKAFFYIWCSSVAGKENNSLSANKYFISRTLLMYN